MLLRERIDREVEARTERESVAWALALGFAIIAAGIVTWLLVAQDDAPMVTFDGTEAVLSGDASVVAGDEIEFTYRNDGGADMAFVAVELLDPTMTLSDLEAYTATASAQEVPPWAGEFHITMVAAGEEVTEILILTEGTWTISVNSSPLEGDRIFASQLIDVR